MEVLSSQRELTIRYVGNDWNTEIQNLFEGEFEELETKVENLHDFLETAPNLNSDYAEEIAMVEQEFTKDDLEIAPIYILDAEEFEQAQRILGSSGDTYGGYMFGRTVVNAGMIRGDNEALNRQRVLGTLIHESAHSTGGSSELAFTAEAKRERLTREISGYYLRGSGVILETGFIKNKIAKGHLFNDRAAFYQRGLFWEEAFADLTRVRYLKRLGLEPKADGVRIVCGSLMYIGEGARDSSTVHNTLLPVRFAHAASTEDGRSPVAIGNVSGIAAHGLDLLDRHSPDLFEVMQAARSNPDKQREMIRIINGIKPGLYTKIADQPYTEFNFRRGLQDIKEALQYASRPQDNGKTREVLASKA